jgi:outer membrane immunogenic protein
MKKLATIAVAGLIATPAFATDMGVPPPPPPAPVYNWTGFYVGGNAGVGLGTYKTDLNASGTSSVFQSVITAGGPVTTTNLLANFAGSGFDEVYPAGFVGGGQAGFNWQLSPLWVVGVEADFQGADEKEHSTPTIQVGGPFSSFGIPIGAVSETAAFDYTAKIEWFGTARGALAICSGMGRF